MRPEELTAKLTRLRQQIETQRADKNRAEGQLTALMRQLKDEFGFDRVEDAEARLKEMQAEIDAADRQIEQDVAGFEKKYGLTR